MRKSVEKMDTIEDVFQTLKFAYPHENVTLLQNEVVVLKGTFQIVGYSLENECVQLNEKSSDDKCMPITHCHPESYNEIYDAIVFYMNNSETLMAQHQKELSQYRRRTITAGIALFIGIILLTIIKTFV